MPENKNNDLMNKTGEELNVNSGIDTQPQNDVFVSAFGEAVAANKNKKRARKKLPIIVDVIVAVLMLAMIAGIVVGAYFLFTYYSDKYESREITYTFITPYDETRNNEVYSSILNKEIYNDTSGDTLYFGKVTKIDVSKNQKIVILTVKAEVKYLKEEGYSIGDVKIAVGGEYVLRSQDVIVSGSIVDLITDSQKGGNK